MTTVKRTTARTQRRVSGPFQHHGPDQQRGHERVKGPARTPLARLREKRDDQGLAHAAERRHEERADPEHHRQHHPLGEQMEREPGRAIFPPCRADPDRRGGAGQRERESQGHEDEFLGRIPTPIFSLTANAMPEHIAASAEAGADGHLSKPITADGLLARVEEGWELAASRRSASEPKRKRA